MKRPNYIQLTVGLLVSFFQSFGSEQKITLPKKIGKYILVRAVRKDKQFKFYSVGIYSYRGKKVFIKRWEGSIKNFSYYLLINEYMINTIINSKSEKLNRGGTVRLRIPKVLEIMQSKNSLSVVFEYIDGNNLDKHSLPVQKKILYMIVKSLSSYSNNLSSEEKKYFPVRSKLFYFFTLPLFLSVSLISNPKSSLVLYAAFFRAVRNLKFYQLFKNYCLAHRDLDLENIIVKNSDVYIVDCGNMVLTVPNYDAVFISLNPKLKYHSKSIVEKYDGSLNEFLRNYIAIQHSKTYGNPKNYDNYFLKSLYLSL